MNKTKCFMRYRHLVFIAAAILLVNSSLEGALERTISEYEVKAAYVYNFARFTDWPAEAFQGNSSPIVIVIVGNNEFASMLTNMVKDKTIQNRPILVRTMKWPADFSNCHIVYISSYEQQRTAQIAGSLHNAPVLTVTEAERSARSKGLINLLVEAGKVFFEVDLTGAANAKLKISSKLLRLANAFSE
jgi:hypothetical protein